LARIILGATGVALAGAGAAVVWVATIHWPAALFADPPSLGLIGYGVSLLFACAFYDEIEISTRRLGIPVVRRARHPPK
jgi:hypothetical protein